jgi:uncharacterized protein
MSAVQLSKADVRRAMVRHQFALCKTQEEVFDRLRSIQFDPIAPVGCNHDLVLQARLPSYKIGDWEKLAYKDRHIYDGWDKMASLVPFEGWPLRRVIYTIHRRGFEKKIFEDHKDAVEVILKEIADRGPMQPKDFEFQQRREEWKGTWFGPSVTKQTLRALWHSGLIMTSGRKSGQHLYDLTERVVPKKLLKKPQLPHDEAVREITLERHRQVGIIRPNASAEMWSYSVMYYDRQTCLPELVRRKEIIPVEIEGIKAHATPEFLALLDQPALKPRVIFVGPLDQIMWDRKMIAHLFGFDYVWEIYKPEKQRKWGYYVLPVLFGDKFVARAEFWCRDGVLELREWHYENGDPGPTFWPALEKALKDFMKYSSSSKTKVKRGIDAKVRDLFRSVSAK